MGVKPPALPPAFTPKQLAQITKDNQLAQAALEKRSQALDETIDKVQARLAEDPALAAYPKAQERLGKIKESAEAGKGVVTQEQEVRARLGEAAAAGDSAGVRQAQADLVKLKKDNAKAYGKGSVASPVTECPDPISTATCDAAIANLGYQGATGPGSPLSSTAPCYGTSLAEWDGWDDLIAKGCATAEERDMITAMSANEGSFEAVQSYDTMALTAGAMQKTVNSTGGGELSDQLTAFKAKDPASFQRLFADHGWTVKNRKTYFEDAAGTQRTGSDLQSYLRSANHANQVKALAPLRAAGRDPAFRKQQVCDFISRSRDANNRSVAIGGAEYKAGDVLTSTKGKALLLDTSVNAGPNEAGFQRALNWFYQAHPKVGKDPTQWTPDERVANEAAIADRYAATRPVNDRDKRNSALSNLSAAPDPEGLASQRPATHCPDCT